MLKQKLQAEYLQSLKAGDKDKVQILRYFLAKVKNEEIDKEEDLTDEEVISLLKKQKKELLESIESFEKGKRKDLEIESKKQLEIILEFIPPEISDEELNQEIEKIIEKNKDIFNKNPKMLIGICIKALKSKAESSRIIKILKQKS